MTNKEAISYAAKHSFVELYQKGYEDGAKYGARCGTWHSPDEIPEGEGDLILCVSGKAGNVTYEYASVGADCGYDREYGKFYMYGFFLGKYFEGEYTLHGWMYMPEYRGDQSGEDS